MAYFLAANVGTTGYPFLSMANANTLLAHASPNLVDRFARPLLSGRFMGTMCLTEPDAGSSLADVQTRAEPCTDGTYRLFGTKAFISAGDHELSETIVHLVLARIAGAPAGSKGLSLFVVPKHCVDEAGNIGERNDVALIGINHKMGFRATTNCILSFGGGAYKPRDAAGAIGYLVGEPGRGLRCMFHMMNEARIGVGLGAAMLGWSGYLHSVIYAKARIQGRPIGAAGESSPPSPIIHHCDVKRMLLAQRAYASAALALCLYCARLVDDARTAPSEHARHRAELLLGLLTPVAKSWPSQWCLAANDLAIQVHGGYGYTRDFPVEQFYRDNRLNPIHEGTHGIQALDLLGRKIRGAAFDAFANLCAIVDDCCARAANSSDRGIKEFARDVLVAWRRLADITVRLRAEKSSDLALSHATVYLEAFGHCVVAWLLLDQINRLPSVHSPLAEMKRAVAWYFRQWELPRIHLQIDLLASFDTAIVNVPENIF
jgi:butyryl-CoA dehydrogenase